MALAELRFLRPLRCGRYKGSDDARLVFRIGSHTVSPGWIKR